MHTVTFALSVFGFVLEVTAFLLTVALNHIEPLGGALMFMSEHE